MNVDYELVEELVENVVAGYGWGIYSPRLIDDGGAPMIQTGDGDKLRVPDTKANRDGQEVWVETKGKGKASLHRNTGDRVHGIDTVKWEDYTRTARETGDRTYLFVYEEKTGMLLRRCTQCLHVHHDYPNGGANGEHMTYFDREELGRVPIRKPWVPAGLNPQINLHKDPEHIPFKIFPHEMDGAAGVKSDLTDYGDK